MLNYVCFDIFCNIIEFIKDYYFQFYNVFYFVLIYFGDYIEVLYVFDVCGYIFSK